MLAKLVAQAVLFDVDGTLLRTAEVYYEIMRRTCAAMDIPAPGPDVVNNVMVHGRELLQIVFPPGWPERDKWVQRFRAQAARIWQEVFLQEARPVAGVVDALAALRRQGLRLGIVTSAERRVLGGLAAAGLDTWFETTVTREHVPAHKPHPGPLLLGAAQLGLLPAACIYVGDTPMDLAAGRAAGMATVAVLSGTTPRDLLVAQAPDLILDSAADLAEHVEVATVAVSSKAAVVALTGRVRRGLGEAQGFVALDWVQEQVSRAAGFRPYPGTLNLETVFPTPPEIRALLDRCAAVPLVPPGPGICASDCFPGFLVGGDAAPLPAAVILPAVDGYPADKLELVTPVHARDALSLAEDQLVTVVLAVAGATPAAVAAAVAAFAPGRA